MPGTWGKHRTRLARGLLAALLGCGMGTARAETLADAMAAALARHPSLRAEEARGRAAGHAVDVARSGYFPRVTATGEVGAASGNRGLRAGSDDRSGTPGGDWSGRWAYGLSAEQPLFDGFRTSSAVAEARAGVEAANAQVQVSAQVVQLEAVAAFCDVVRDREIEALRRREVAMLAEQVAAAEERARRGAGTETEIAQARARSSLALADLLTARANAASSAAEYQRVVGREPGRLAAPAIPEQRLPRALSDAIATAAGANPAGHAAEAREQASRHGIDKVRADGLPQVALRAGIDGERSFRAEREPREGASVGVKVSVPLFDGGETAARVRQAHELSTSAAEEARGVRDRITASVSQAFARLAAFRERRGLEDKAVADSRKALAGINEEIRLGQRALIDGLDAQRELTAAEARAAAGRRDVVVAAYALLSDMGALADAAGAPSPAARAAPGGSTWHTHTQRK